ncbi:MAG: response regulator [Planctomycetota bacterium]
MKFAQLNPGIVRRAIALYLDHAWPEQGARGPTLDLDKVLAAPGLKELLECFEASCDMTGHLERYTLRLGNLSYPFMKFVVQEHLIHGEYFFSVDTHDNLDIRPSHPDYSQWESLKGRNRALKAKIEAAWHAEGLPTNEDLYHLMAKLAQVETEGSKQRRILVVDDEAPIALGIAECLRARGYVVELASDGREALDAIARRPPDLVLLDFEMPELDGETVLSRMRADARTANVPVLMATAAEIDLTRLTRVSGFLRKPYPRQVLFEMIGRLMEPGSSDADEVDDGNPGRRGG